MTAYKHPRVKTHDGEIVVGEEYGYMEDGYSVTAIVVKDESNEEYIRFRIRTTRRATFFGEAGREFTVYADRSETVVRGGAWRFLDKSRVV